MFKDEYILSLGFVSHPRISYFSVYVYIEKYIYIYISVYIEK